MQPRWSSSLEPAQLQPKAFEATGKAARGCFPHSTAFRFLLPRMHQRTQKSSGGNDNRTTGQARAVAKDDTAHRTTGILPVRHGRDARGTNLRNFSSNDL